MTRNQNLDTDTTTSQRLAKQKQKDTKPEIAVRRLLRSLGHRYSLKNRDLPGSPDIANRSRGWAVFVHGCYWHHHEGCPKATVPKRNRDFWIEKFMSNRERDSRVQQQLEEDGFVVIVIWECELVTPEVVRTHLERKLPSAPA